MNNPHWQPVEYGASAREWPLGQGVRHCRRQRRGTGWRRRGKDLPGAPSRGAP
jgi:hypothetical protein